MSYYHDDDGSEEAAVRYMKNILFWTVVLCALAIAVVLVLGTAVRASQKTTIIGGCDDSLWRHVYNSSRLEVHEACASVTGVIVDATHGKRKQGCRSEADGDLHCWLKLDAGQERYVNTENAKNQDGNLVFEPMCQHKVTQTDAIAACKNWKQKLALPKIGAHVRITGAFVLDTQHGHREIHPISSIEVLK